MSVYDKWGFDEEGFNREGFNKLGFDRDGYNKQGYNIHGINRKGINQRTLRDSDGYDADGYDIDGFNRDGLDKEGYDHDGFNIIGFNREGFDREGYTVEGYDKDGYNREGYNAYGYDRNGFDRNGIDKDGFNRAGYDQNGFDRLGYDKDGFDKGGYDKEGYDREGFNIQGIDKQGVDRDGYDAEGYDRDGFNVEGFNRKGFNRDGYNIEGYDCEGYDRNGYDKKGFNRKGFDIEGYDKNGYDINGYDQRGFDKKGYDKDGYNQYGVNISGYDREGYDRWGFNKDGIDRNGFDIYGYNAEGFNILGYDQEGFDRDGIHRDGFARSDFDEKGYHLFTGFNLQGYDKDGFNINGFNEEGYDRDGFNIDGYDKEGYNRNGLNRNGYDRDGFNINGFNTAGYDKAGYDIDGYNTEGLDREGYNREGYDQEGYDRYGYDRNGKKKRIGLSDLKVGMTVYHKKYGGGIIKRFKKGKIADYIVLTFPMSKEEFTFLFPNAFTGDGASEVFLSIEKPDELKQKEDSFIEEEDEKEKKRYSDITRYLRGDYLKIKQRLAEAEYTPGEIRYIDVNGLITTKEVGPGRESIKHQVEIDVERIIAGPYFSHIDYQNNHNLYIGKKEIPGYVTDWADKKASLYYQYQMYIGNKSIDLKLVREIDFGSKKYLGYRDLYNSFVRDNTIESRYADERLSKIIASNQENKKIHDIIETIQQNQYEIITQDKNQSILVLGCAGSGKTMILMHRIRYMKYNDPRFDMKSVMVISPTDILEKESQELSKILDVGAIRQMTMTAFYESVVDDLLNEFYEEPNLLEKAHVSFQVGDISLFDEDILNSLLREIKGLLHVESEDSKGYRNIMTKELEESRKSFHDKYGSYREFQHLQSLYRKAKEELSKYGEDEFYKVIHHYESTEEEIEKISKELKLAELVYAKAGLKTDTEENDEKEDYFGFLSYTRQLTTFVDLDEFYLYIKRHEVACDTPTKLIQLLCAFKSLSGKGEIAENLLLRARNELDGYSDRYVFEYIERLKKRKKALEEMPKKSGVFRYLIANGLIKNHSKSSKLTDQQLLTVGNDIIAFFDAMHWEKGQENPFTDFEDYEEIQNKTKRLKEFEQGESKWRFLQDIILEKLNVFGRGGIYYVDSAQEFAMCFLLAKLSGIKNKDKRYWKYL